MSFSKGYRELLNGIRDTVHCINQVWPAERPTKFILLHLKYWHKNWTFKYIIHQDLISLLFHNSAVSFLKEYFESYFIKPFKKKHINWYKFDIYYTPNLYKCTICKYLPQLLASNALIEMLNEQLIIWN